LWFEGRRTGTRKEGYGKGERKQEGRGRGRYETEIMLEKNTQTRKHANRP
jgi:hypothetical protein